MRHLLDVAGCPLAVGRMLLHTLFGTPGEDRSESLCLPGCGCSCGWYAEDGDQAA